MKRAFALIPAVLLCAALTACSNTSENGIGENESIIRQKRSLEGVKKVGGIVDKVTFVNTFEDLESQSELIVIGEFTDNSKACYKRYGDSGIQKNEVLYGVSSCPMKITKVLAGDAQVGDVVNVLQDEWFEKNCFATLSYLTPMQMGDEWLFCLEHAKAERYGDGYWCVGDNCGRYPTKNSGSNEVICFSDYPELGVYEKVSFREDLYNALIEKYGEF